MGKKAYEDVEPLHEDHALTADQIRAYARQVAYGIEMGQRKAFFDTWLNKLNLGGVVSRLEEQGKITA